jgi:methyl-accepting chemotaxis protein
LSIFHERFCCLVHSSAPDVDGGCRCRFWLVAAADCLDVVLGLPGDIRQVSGDVAAASRALALVSGAQSALQAQQRGLNSMLLRNFMAAEFDKGQAEFLAGARPSGSNWPNSKPRAARRVQGPARIAEIRKLATELNQLYDQVLAENEPGMPKYALMVDAAIRDADTPLVTLLAETFGAISEATRRRRTALRRWRTAATRPMSPSWYWSG